MWAYKREVIKEKQHLYSVNLAGIYWKYKNIRKSFLSMNNQAQHNKNSLTKSLGGGGKEVRCRLKPTQNMDGLLLQDEDGLWYLRKEN